MQLELENTQNPNSIRHYQAGSVQINGQEYHSNLLVTADTIESWEIESSESANLTELNLTQLLQHKPDVILLGTGANMQFLPQTKLLELQQQGIGIEVMTTAAACRTFNVLLSEDRNVLAALII